MPLTPGVPVILQGCFEDNHMANPVFRTNQFSYSFAQPEHLMAKISFGASGAPTIVANTGMGISSITRSSTGTYVITISHAYQGLLMLNHRFITTGSAPAASGLYISNDSSSNGTAATITIVTNSSGTATDPASGEIMLLDIKLQKSSVRY